MTDERLEELRALCQREYGVSPSIACEMLAEVDELRQRVTAFEAFAQERRDTYERMAQRDECDFPVDARAFAAMQMAFNEAIVQGLELGLWK